MTIFLSQILEHKKQEVAAAKTQRPLKSLIETCEALPSPWPFRSALKSVVGRVGLIAEVKKASPSAGVIRADFDPVKIAAEYEAAGATCLSVLTDEQFFQGHLSYLAEIKRTVSLPILRKDFIVDDYQIYEARAAGADAVLLIVAALEVPDLYRLYDLGKALGLDVLVEAHTVEEMQIVSSLGADLVGINSRDLKSFVTNLDIIERLAPLAPPTALLVAESGIKTAADVHRLRRCGINTILVGETLMRASSIDSAIADLTN